MKNTKYAILPALGILLLTACSAPTKEPASNTTAALDGLVLTAEVNPETSVVTLPGSRFYLSESETDTFVTAKSVSIAVCAQENGIKWYASDLFLDDPANLMYYDFGPWTQDMASRFGFARPARTADLIENGVLDAPPGYAPKPHPNLALSESDDKKMDKCRQASNKSLPTAEELSDQQPAAVEELLWNNIITKVHEDKDFQTATADLKACYLDSGLQVKDVSEEELVNAGLPFNIAGANVDTIDEQQIQLALKDVACKQKTDFINRVAQIWASYEAPIIKENAAELVEYRDKIDAAVTKARAYIDSHRDVIWTNKEQ